MISHNRPLKIASLMWLLEVKQSVFHGTRAPHRLQKKTEKLFVLLKDVYPELGEVDELDMDGKRKRDKRKKGFVANFMYSCKGTAKNHGSWLHHFRELVQHVSVYDDEQGDEGRPSTESFVQAYKGAYVR